MTSDVQSAVERRIIVYQLLFATAVIMCVINTYVSILIIVLLQINSAIAPTVRPLNRF